MICYNFFFFKQKTAYEMRISDWSSDVCSSDLPDADKSAVAQVLDQNGIRYDFDNSGGMTVGEDDYFKAKMMLAAQGLPKSAPDGNSMIEIGRASSRESVWQYV